MKAIKAILQSIWRQSLKSLWIRCANRYYSRMKKEKYPQVLMRRYKKHFGKTLNLENPQTFTEKIQWSKLYDRNPMKSKLADKYDVREWIAETIGEEYLIPLLGAWDNADDIDFDALAEQFILKATHGSKWNIIVKDKNKLNVKKTRKQLRNWLEWSIAYRSSLELHYAGIKPRIIAEAYIEDTSCGELPDYKFLCFNGKPYYCYVDVERFANHKRNIYDLEWNLLPWEYYYPSTARILDKPSRYEEMIEIASRLCKEFSFVRVDLYNVGSKVYFGEMTFTPGSGFGKFNPPEYDAVLGALWELEG